MFYTNKIITALWLRRAHLVSYARGFFWFRWTHLWIKFFFNSSQVIIGKKTRVQSLRCFLVTSKEAQIHIGPGSLIYENARLEALEKGYISIGKESILGDCRISCRQSVKIGSYFLTSWNVFIQDHNPHPTEASQRNLQMQQIIGLRNNQNLNPIPWDPRAEAIHIGDSVWLGANVTILKGVHLGEGCIVAANSVVTRGQYPAFSLLAGNPAQIIKSLKRTPL